MFKLRKPRLRVTGKGLRVTKPSLQIGGKGAHLNVGARGVSQTTRVGQVSHNTRRGCSIPCLPMLILLTLPMLGLGFAFIAQHVPPH